MTSTRLRVRKIHRWFAPLMAFPLLLTIVTGFGFQLAVTTGNTQEFLWLLDLHRGKFGSINLENIYPFLNAIGLFILLTTGIWMWLQIPRHRSPSNSP